MSWCSKPLTLLLLLLAASSSACGYHFTAASPITMPRGITRLHLQRVDNPTTQSWLDPQLRSVLREEFTRRGNVAWVEPGEAEGLLHVEIVSYSSATKLENVREQTVKSEVVLKLRAGIRDPDEGSQIWRSGVVRSTESFTGPKDGPQSRQAGTRAVELGVEKLADELGQNF
jgi:outer membrane lipopolysaccharide assembly protein LptE/RlpB